ncbi:MAG: ATP-binding protein [Lachnospiraceae bacterium]|nr:ATP-binding protein [Lachnospiraceae bacterium]
MYVHKRARNNNMRMEFDSVAENVALARMAVSGFILPFDPTMDEINDIKTAVSEAVTNAIIHGYERIKGTVEKSVFWTNYMMTQMIMKK